MCAIWCGVVASYAVHCCVYVRINLAHFMQFLGNVVHKLWKENVAHNIILEQQQHHQQLKSVHSRNSYSNGFIMHIAAAAEGET